MWYLNYCLSVPGICNCYSLTRSYNQQTSVSYGNIHWYVTASYIYFTFYFLRFPILFKEGSKSSNGKKSGFLASQLFVAKCINTFMTNFTKIYFYLESNFIFESDMRLDPLQSLLRAPLLEGRRTKRASHIQMSTNLWEHNTIYYKIDKVFGKFQFHGVFFSLNTLCKKSVFWSVFSPNAVKCWPEQLRIRTLFTQWEINPLDFYTAT